MESIVCNNEEEHMFHEHEVIIQHICTGKSECGAHVHSGHVFTTKEKAWCRGVCKCGLRNFPHGPGSHK